MNVQLQFTALDLPLWNVMFALNFRLSSLIVHTKCKWCSSDCSYVCHIKSEFIVAVAVFLTSFV